MKLPFGKLKKPVFVKTLMSYLLVFTLPLFLLGVTGYWWVSGMIIDKAKQSYMDALVETRKNMDVNFQSLNKFSVQLPQKPWVKKIMYMGGDQIDYNRINQIDMVNYLDELSSYTILNNFVSDIAIIFNEINTVLSTQGSDTTDSFFENAFVFSDADSVRWDPIQKTVKVSGRTPLVKVNNYGRLRNVYTYMQTLPPSDKYFKATLLVFIDEYKLKNALNNSFVTDNGALYLYNSDGKFITGINESGGTSAESLGNVLRSGPKGSSFDLINADNKKYVCFYTQSSVNGLKYAAAVSVSVIMDRISSLKIYIAVILAVSVLIGLLLSYRLAVYNYKPLYNIINLVRTKIFPKDGNHFNEYGYLQTIITDILNLDYRVKYELEIYKPYVRDACLLKLIKGKSGNIPEIGEAMHLLGIEFKAPCFNCVAILSNTGNASAESIRNEISLNMLPSGTSSFYVIVDEKIKAVILNMEDGSSLEHLVEVIGSSLRNTGIDYKALGVGRSYKGMENLCRSFEEAVIAIDYRFLKGNIVIFDELDWEHSSILNYPMDKKKHLINHIHNGDYASAAAIASEVLNENVNDKKMLSIGEIRCLYYELAVEAFKALEDLKLLDPVPVRLDVFFNTDDINGMNSYIKEIYSHICNVVSDAKKSKNGKLTREILNYLKTNCYDVNLSLTSLAEVFDLTPVYLSRFFKKQTGCNFIDYLNKLRIEESKRLLAGDGTIGRIAQEIGFASDITFRRMFKKLEGVTPGQFKSAALLSKKT